MSRPSDLRRIARRCWVTPEQAADPVGRCSAVLATCMPDTVIASITAALLHRLWLPTEIDRRIHVAAAVPDQRGRLMTRTQRPEIVAHRFQLRPEDIVLIDGVPVTSLARTWRDLAMVFSLPDLVAAGDCALRAGATLDELRSVLEASSRRHNAARAWTALSLLDARSRSRPESHLRVAVSGGGMPKFEVNVAISRKEGGWLAEPDLSLEEAMIALEYQGADHAEVKRMRRDITRSVDVRRNDWAILPYGPAEVFGEPWLIWDEVRDLVEVRAPQLLGGRARRRPPAARIRPGALG